MKVALVGAGRIGERHLRTLTDLGATVAGIADSDGDRARSAVQRYGGQAFTDVERLLETVGPDAVFICTPPTTREPIVRAVARRRLACFMEKPPAFDGASARRIQDLVQEAGIVHTVGFMWRWSLAVDTCRELLQDMPVSFVQSLYCDDLFANPQQPVWFLDKHLSGGPVLDQALHILDLCRYLLGEVDAVSSMGNNVLFPGSVPAAEQVVEEAVVVNLRYRSGVIQSHVHSWAQRTRRGSIDFCGHQRRVVLDLTGQHTVSVWEGGEKVQDHHFTENDPYRREVEMFLRAVEASDQRLLRSPIGDARQSLDLALRINAQLDDVHVEGR